MNLRQWALGLAIGAAAAGVCASAGCETQAVNKDRKTTFLDADDMVTMTNQMAQSLVMDPRIQAEAAKGPLKIVIKPVVNLTDEILPRNQGELFVARLQGLLGSQPSLSNKFVWVINKTDYDKLRAQEIPPEKLGQSEDRIIPEYALYAEFHSLQNVTRQERSNMYDCVYKLTKISGGNEGLVLWTGSYVTSKSFKRNFLD